MANEQDKNPTTGTESDISKAQSQQQPEQGQQAGQFEASRQGNPNLSGDQATGDQQPQSPGAGQQSDTLTQQRTDVEGASLQSERGEAESGFVGAQGQQDMSSELVNEEDEEFARDGQGAPEDE